MDRFKSVARSLIGAHSFLEVDLSTIPRETITSQYQHPLDVISQPSHIYNKPGIDH